MALTFEDVRDRLKNLDEITLLEVLDISSEELVDRFGDRIEDRLIELQLELEDEKEDGELSK